MNDASRFRSALGFARDLLKRRWRFVAGFVLFALILNLVPEIGFAPRRCGWPAAWFFYGYRWSHFNFGNLGYDIFVCALLFVMGITWRELRHNSSPKQFQFRLIDLIFGTVLLAGFLAWCADMRRELGVRRELESVVALYGGQCHSFRMSTPWWLDHEPEVNSRKKTRALGRVVSWGSGNLGMSADAIGHMRRNLTEFKHLESLTLHRALLSTSETEKLRLLPNLYHVEVVLDENPREHLVNLAQIPSLRILSVDSKILTDRDLEPLKSAKYLQALSLTVGPEFQGESLGQFTNLKRLVIYRGDWTSATFKAMGQLKNLEELRLHNIPLENGISSTDWKELANLRKLEVVSLHKVEPTSTDWIDVFRSLPELRELQVNGSLATSDVLMRLTEFPPDLRVRISRAPLLTNDDLIALQKIAKERKIPYFDISFDAYQGLDQQLLHELNRVEWEAKRKR